MSIAVTTVENGFGQLVALFLAEIIRSRRTSLRRAAEIAYRFVSLVPSLSSETEALEMLTAIEREFEEVAALKQALHFGYNDSDIKVYEKEIKEFASMVFVQDMVQSATFLQDAARPEMTIQKLCLRYPQFCGFMATTDKAPLLGELQVR